MNPSLAWLIKVNMFISGNTNFKHINQGEKISLSCFLTPSVHSLGVNSGLNPKCPDVSYINDLHRVHSKGFNTSCSALCVGQDAVWDSVLVFCCFED